MDALSVALLGGVRVRVIRVGADPVAEVHGNKKAHPRPGLVAVLSSYPEGTGVVHVWRDRRRGYRIHATGALSRGGFLQRFRNVLLSV
jgi:hypothetical protein